MISVLRSIFHPLEALILLTALYVSTAIFPDLKPTLISFIGHQAFILVLMDIFVKIFIGTAAVGFFILVLAFFARLVVTLGESAEDIPVLGTVLGFISDVISGGIDLDRWYATSIQVLLDSVLWCISFMAIRFYWDAEKGTGESEAITFLKYLHDNYGISTWMLSLSGGIVFAIVLVRMLAHRFD